jgi:hypothetical protein
MKKTFTLTVEVDEKTIAKKYPNYALNYGDPKIHGVDHFINERAKAAEAVIYDDIYDGTPKSMMKLFGYRVTVKENP